MTDSSNVSRAARMLELHEMLKPLNKEFKALKGHFSKCLTQGVHVFGNVALSVKPGGRSQLDTEALRRVLGDRYEEYEKFISWVEVSASRVQQVEVLPGSIRALKVKGESG